MKMSKTPIADLLRRNLEENPADLDAVVEAVAALELAEVKREKDRKMRETLYGR